MTVTEVHVHVHVDGSTDSVSVHVSLPPDITELKGLIMATKEEILASLADVKASLVELQKDTTRIIADLDAAVQAQDLTAVAAAVDDLKSTVGTIDAAVEAASPEPTETP
jgi:hypothetical protein